MCIGGRVVVVVTGPDSGEEEVQSRRVRLGKEGCMDGGTRVGWREGVNGMRLGFTTLCCCAP